MIRSALPQCDAFDWIYDPDGSPDTGKLVTLVKVVDASGNPISFEQRHTFTDDAGQYHFTLPQGSTAYLQARASGLWAANGPVAFAVPMAPSGQLVPTTEPQEIVGVQPPLILDRSTLSIPRASTTQDGYLAAEDFALFAEGGSGVGTVTEIDTGAGLTGGPITEQGTIALAPVAGLLPGTYTGPLVLQVDIYGRITGISSGSDTIPPVISAVTATSITPTGATITWHTDEQSDSLVEYGTSTSYGSSSMPDSTLVTSHTRVLSSLVPGTLYHYRVKSNDISANLATSADFTFTTSAAVDTTPPVISAVAGSSITSAGATITWTTNEAADSQIEYGTTTAYGSQTTLSATLVTSHSQPLTGLLPGVLYHFRVKSRDGSGNLATGTDNTFTTTTAPTISAVNASGLTTSGATITWTTDVPANSQVEYGTSTSYGSSTTLDAALVTSHNQPITGLTAGTLYHFRVKSADASSNMATSSDFTFTTLTSSSLLTGLMAYWKLDEATGTRADSVPPGTYALTVGGTVSSVAGKVGNAASLPGSGSAILYTSTTHPTFTSGLSVAGWMKMNSAGPSNLNTLFSHWGSTNPGFVVCYDHSAGVFKFTVSPEGSTFVECLLTMAITFGTWYHIAAVWNGTQLKISVNNGTPVAVAFTGPINNPAAAGMALALLGTSYSDCVIDELGVWTRGLTAAEITEHFNDGNTGVSYPF